MGANGELDVEANFMVNGLRLLNMSVSSHIHSIQFTDESMHRDKHMLINHDALV